MTKDKRPGGMRRGLTSYGDDDFALFLCNAFIKAMGYSDDALERPIVGIANTSRGYNLCHRTVPDLVEAGQGGVTSPWCRATIAVQSPSGSQPSRSRARRTSRTLA